MNWACPTNNSRNGGVEDFLLEVTGGKLCEAMIDCTGAQPVLGNMHNYVCHGGRIALVGWPHGEVSFNQTRLMQKEIDVCPSRNSCGKFPEAIELIHKGELPIHKMLTKVIDLAQVEETIQDMMIHPGDYLKVVTKI